MAIKNKRLKLLRGSTYTFDVSNPALANNPLKFTADSGTTEYTSGITLTGTQGQSGASLEFVVPTNAPNNLNYYGDSTSLKMGNHALIPGAPYDPPSPPASPDYTDSAVSTNFFLNAIKAYGADSDVNTYSNQLTQLYSNFSDPETLTTNGEYTCFSDNGMSIYHTGPGTTGSNVHIASAGWSWILRNRDGALMKSWNGLIKDYDHTNLDMEEFTPSGTTLYSKYHRAGFGNAVRSNENFLFISCAYRPATMSEPNNNWADDRAFIFVYDFTPPFALRKIIKLEDFNTTDCAHSSTVGYAGGGSGWTEQEFTVGDDWLIVPASYANYYGNSTEGGRLTYWDISDPDPSNWSSTPDAVIQNPINVVSSPTQTWNSTLYSNKNFGQGGAVIRHNKLTTGHSIHRYTYTKSGNSFSLDTSTVVGPYSSYSQPPYIAWTNDSSSPKFLSFNYGTQGSSTTRRIQLIDPSNSHNADWTLDLNAVSGSGYPFGVQPLTVGKDVKIELFSYGDAYRGGNGKAGQINFRKLSDRSEVLALDNPLLRESDGLYFGDNYVHHAIDSDNSNRYSLVAWGEPDDVDTKDIYSFYELTWDSANGVLALEDPPIPPISFGTTQGAISFDTEFDFSNNANNPAMPMSPVFNNDGTKLFYLAGGSFANTMQVFAMDLSTPYEISSIDSSTSGSILDLNTDSDFHNIFTNEPYSGAYDENNPLYLWFKPDGTKMYISGNNWDTVIQYALDSAWNPLGGRTAEHKIGTGYMGGWSTNTMQNNWTYSSQLEMQNWYSHEWIKDGYSLVSGYANDRGASIEQTFSTPYDLSTVTSNFTAQNIVDHTHTLYGDSDNDGATFGQRTRKLGAAYGGQFNHDGTERYFLQTVWNDTAFDGGGNGNTSMRVSLVKATLSTPYDITTMTYHSQVELTNLPNGIDFARVSGTFTFSPDGRKLYWMTYADHVNGSDVFDRARLFQFSSTGDSAGSVFIREPDTTVLPFIQALPSNTWGGTRALSFSGSPTGSAANTENIDMVDISTFGNASDFGNMTYGTTHFSACGDTSKIIHLGGQQNRSGYPRTQLIEYVNSATPGNAQQHGYLQAQRFYGVTHSNGTNYILATGLRNLQYSNTIEYGSIQTTGNAGSFGTLNIASTQCCGTNDLTRGVYAGGARSGVSYANDMDYITMATPGNGTDFGDLLGVRKDAIIGNISDNTTGVFCGGTTTSDGNTYVNNIDKITIATTGNATDFGNLTGVRALAAGASDELQGGRGIIMGGKTAGSPAVVVNNIDYITIASPGNASDFGDMATNISENAGASGAAA